MIDAFRFMGYSRAIAIDGRGVVSDLAIVRIFWKYVSLTHRVLTR